MDYRDIARVIQEHGNGTHGFDKAADAALGAAKEHPDKAAGFFLLGFEAREFVNMFDRMPVTEGSAIAARKRLEVNADALDAAGDDGAMVLDVLNKMALAVCSQ